MSNDTEIEIRRDERNRVATLLEDHATTIADFAVDKESLVGLVALMLRIENAPPDSSADGSIEWLDDRTYRLADAAADEVPA